MYGTENTPSSPPQASTNYMSHPHNPLFSFKESPAAYREVPSIEAYSTPSYSPPTDTNRQGSEQSAMAAYNLQDQIKALQTLYPHMSNDQLIAHHHSMQTRKASTASTNNADIPSNSRREAYPYYGGDPQSISVQSPTFSSEPIDLTPVRVPVASGPINCCRLLSY